MLRGGGGGVRDFLACDFFSRHRTPAMCLFDESSHQVAGLASPREMLAPMEMFVSQAHKQPKLRSRVIVLRRERYFRARRGLFLQRGISQSRIMTKSRSDEATRRRDSGFLTRTFSFVSSRDFSLLIRRIVPFTVH